MKVLKAMLQGLGHVSPCQISIQPRQPRGCANCTNVVGDDDDHRRRNAVCDAALHNVFLSSVPPCRQWSPGATELSVRTRTSGYTATDLTQRRSKCFSPRSMPKMLHNNATIRLADTWVRNENLGKKLRWMEMESR